MAAVPTKCQIVDGQGAFQGQNLQGFTADARLAESKTDYQVVAIMGRLQLHHCPCLLCAARLGLHLPYPGSN